MNLVTGATGGVGSIAVMVLSKFGYNVTAMTGKKDKSGNPILPDIGDVLKKEIKEYGKDKGIEVTMKYLDPTYMIRGCPANTFDINYCA